MGNIEARLEQYIEDGKAKIAAALAAHPGAHFTALMDVGEAILRHLVQSSPEVAQAAEGVVDAAAAEVKEAGAAVGDEIAKTSAEVADAAVSAVKSAEQPAPQAAG